MLNFELANKKIFVAGHTGMVGGAIARRLQKESCTLLTASSNTLDLRNQSAVQEWFRENTPDVVFLAAARVGGIVANNTYPADFIYDNLMIQTNVIHSAYATGVQRLIFLGSSCIYPKYAEQPIQESALLTGALEPTNQAYAIAKIAGLELIRAYRRQHNANYISLMPTNLYGIGDRYHEQNSHVIPALLMKFHQAKIRGDKTVMVWGSGTPRREFLFADDLADACVYLSKHYFGDDIINVGTGTDISIHELSVLIKEIVGFEGEIILDPTKPDGTPRKLLDVTQCQKLGWRANTQLPYGLTLAYQDYVQRYGSTL